MNIRKQIDYSGMYTAIDKAMEQNLPQMELYVAFGKAVSARSEKGAAVAAAEYLNAHYPDARGFSPRNLRRMCEFYRTYETAPSVLTLAMQVGWTKLELLDKIENKAHEELVLDNGQKICDNDKNGDEEETENPIVTAVKCLLRQFRQRISPRRCRGKPKRGVVPWPTMWLPIFMEKRIAFMRC